ncbi:ArgS-related anticodon-binding protein NrtL [Streptomyces sp. NRRL S-244]|uniref:ArgS-related anticodon-binding protein NrtL n=1 Tax=Streptomyces sp. NRRL S-244 TaxID=1463897 RepID=UPI0004C11E0F|nr:DALR anticodon-binding domain-containing protein [Streptomyces sp. NRRL S-244]
MTPADLSSTVARAVRCAVEDGELPAGAGVPERVVVERTRPGGVGDYATPVAFHVAKTAGTSPRHVADVLARRLGAVAGIERVEVTGPGFLNFVLEPVSVEGLVRDVRAHRLRYGFSGASELRAGVVGAAVRRIELSQGLGTGEALRIAPVARRDGEVVALYGQDAAAWAMLCVAPHESAVFSPRLLVQDESNDFFRVTYGYARTRALLTNAAQLGFGSEAGDVAAAEGGPLVALLAEYPLVLDAAAHRRAPEQLVRFLVRAADELLDFQYCVLPKGDEKPSAAHRARLALAEAAGTVLAGGLALLGIDAPDCL